MPFHRVRDLLNKALLDWEEVKGRPPELSRHNVAGRPPFSWDTAAELRAAWGKGVQLIQPEVIGTGQGARANLVIDLTTGLGGRPRMPKDGPYLTETEIQEIIAWIDEGCPDDPALADEIRLSYGGTPVTFRKSDRLVAVRPGPGMDRAAARALNEIAPAATPGETLGGFQVVTVGPDPFVTDQQLDLLRANHAFDAGSHVFHTSDDEVPFVPTGSVYVVFKPEVPQDRQEQLLEDNHLQIIDARGEGTFITRITPQSPNPLKVASALQQSGDVEVCEPEFSTPASTKAFTPPSGGLLADQWHLRNIGTHRGTSVGFRAGADARVVDAWTRAKTLGSSAVILAVIDDGFDLSHPDLSAPGKVIHAWDFTRNSADPSPDADLQDWHGTACAGVALAQAGAAGVYGAAPGVTLMPIRWGPELNDTQIENWFSYAAARGAWVLSCSWSARAANFPLSVRAKTAIANCARNGRGGKGCVIVFAAGNENRSINNPAAGTVNGFAIHPDVIAVAASNSRDERSNYSNYGTEISICAPSSGTGGWGVLTCDVTGVQSVSGVTRPLGYAPGDYTYEFGGTSSATPLVAGVCALILSASPGLTAAQVKTLLQTTARKIGGLAPGARNDTFGHGCVDAAAAIAAL